MPTAAPQFICGVVEGFYGRPWSVAQRSRLFEWMQAWGLNTYLYAPKDDLKHRAHWRELYAQHEMAELQALMKNCQGKQVDFIYAIAPGLDVDYASAADLQSLLRKAGQLLEAGCQRFAILFDDISPVLSAAAQERFGSVAGAQSFFANALLQWLDERGAARSLLFCPTAYCGEMAGPSVADSAYLRELGQQLDPVIQVFWTGPEVISETIPVESIQELQAILRRKPLLWDNLHANDYAARRLYLGPYAGRPLELRGHLSGILSNPNCEFESNFVPLRTLSLYAQAQSDWQPRTAFRSALQEWLPSWRCYGEVLITLDELELLGDCFYLPYELGTQATQALAQLQLLLRQPPSDWGLAPSSIAKCASDLEQLFAKMTELENRELLYIFCRALLELKEQFAALRLGLTALASGASPTEALAIAQHRSRMERGDLVGELRRLLAKVGNQ